MIMGTNERQHMAGETSITVVGNLTADPELRYTQGGHAVASFTVASTPRTFDKNANEWKDGEALFLRCSAWRDLAEHISSSLTKGTRVIVVGNLRATSWQDKTSGEKRTGMDVDVQAIGPDLRYATVAVQRAQASGRQPAGAGIAQGADWVPASSYDDEVPF